MRGARRRRERRGLRRSRGRAALTGGPKVQESGGSVWIATGAPQRHRRDAARRPASQEAKRAAGTSITLEVARASSRTSASISRPSTNPSSNATDRTDRLPDWRGLSPLWPTPVPRSVAVTTFLTARSSTRTCASGWTPSKSSRALGCESALSVSRRAQSAKTERVCSMKKEWSLPLFASSALYFVMVDPFGTSSSE